VITNIKKQIIGLRFKKRLRHPGLALIPGCALLAHLPLVLAAGFISADLDGKKLLETHDPEVKVSGNIIVGVMVSSAYQGLLKDQLGIQLPDAGDKTVCLKVTSRDGAYMSENNYNVKAPTPTIVYLPYQSGLHDVVVDYTSQQDSIAITTMEGKCHQPTTTDYFLPTILNKENATLEDGNLSIYINGFDATDVSYKIIESGTEDLFDCDYIEEGKHTAYNFTCDISRHELPSSGPATIEISREVYGRELVPVRFRLLPAH
jgi:hypothetical protein